jgi:hypothetical protein
MESDELFLVTHNHLIGLDKNYNNFWDSLENDRRSSILNCWKTIQGFADEHGGISQLEETYSSLTQKYFLLVQQRELEYGRISPNWSYFVRDPKNLQDLLQDSKKRLLIFASRLPVNSLVGFYGGIKPLESILKKIEVTGRSTRRPYKVHLEILDLWDVVRFRFVLDSIESLRDCAIQFWETFFEDILRCQNNYYRPMNSLYRAIHFELIDIMGRIVEVQMMTQNREAVAILDHSLLFKKNVQFIDEQHRNWLVKFSMSANVLDAQTVLRKAISS